MARLFSIILEFLVLGCSSFGGPVAHLGFFYERLVQRQCWLSDAAYAELIALCQPCQVHRVPRSASASA